MNYWIFQGNPDQFKLIEYVQDHDFINWTIRQKHFIGEMKVGDEVYIWQSAGKGSAVAGVIASANIITEPKELPEDPGALKYWHDPASLRAEPRVRLRIKRRCVGSKEMVRRDWIKSDPILKGLLILRLAQNTNYKILPPQAQRLALLTRNTGRDWDRAECVAALWAFERTKRGQVSELPGSPVAEVALAIGRAVGGVYNKLMNFRSIDPNDERKGLSSTNQLDHQIWNEFYDAKAHSLRGALIEAEYQKLWGKASSVPQIPKKTSYKDFGEAPDDDPADIQMFARKVRKGQDKFRKKLLKLYGGRCAISGWAPEEVLEAAHIVEHASSGFNHSDNGILLRSDFHHLLDAGLLSIEPKNCAIFLHSTLRGTPYWQFHGVSLPKRLDGSQIGNKYLVERFGGTAFSHESNRSVDARSNTRETQPKEPFAAHSRQSVSW